MSSRQIDIIIFVLSSNAFMISLKLFSDLRNYINNYGISSNLLFGWNRWSGMSLIISVFLGVLTIAALLKLVSAKSD